MMSPVLRLSLGIVTLAMVVVACGDDDATVTTATTSAPAVTTSTPALPAPPQLQFTFDGITGIQGKVLVGTVFSSAGPLVGTVCVPITTEPFSGSAVVATSSPDNPCSYEAPYGVVVTGDGAYRYLVSVFTPGSQAAESCAAGEVVLVDREVEVVISGPDLAPANCPA